ncbi:MAG: flavin reductase family protein [Lachnospiraceae bacterium]|nr:flavin reductase family protein [Lachnospiraceae bacterium]
MGNVSFKPGNMLYPLPAVLVSVTDGQGNDNVFTVAWTGTICSDPPMVSISVRPSRYSYQMIKDTGEFVINLTTEKLVLATDFCGVRSGRDVDKFKEMNLTKLPAQKVKAPLIGESPVRIECRVTQEILLGSHTMFLAVVEAVSVDDAYMDENDTFHLSTAKPIVYSHGEYYSLKQVLGTFGYSVRKKSPSGQLSNKKKSSRAGSDKKTAAKNKNTGKKNT